MISIVFTYTKWFLYVFLLVNCVYGCFKWNFMVGCTWNCDLQMGLFDFDWFAYDF